MTGGLTRRTVIASGVLAVIIGAAFGVLVLGSGLVGQTDRIQALGGTISVTSPAGKGTELLVDLPIDSR